MSVVISLSMLLVLVIGRLVWRWQSGQLAGIIRENDFAADGLEVYEALEKGGVRYAIRTPANKKLDREIAKILLRPPGQPTSIDSRILL